MTRYLAAFYIQAFMVPQLKATSFKDLCFFINVKLLRLANTLLNMQNLNYGNIFIYIIDTDINQMHISYSNTVTHKVSGLCKNKERSGGKQHSSQHVIQILHYEFFAASKVSNLLS